MDYISTKELAEKWQISESRIVRLAKAGRIKGAKLVGKSWLFDPDSEKPQDGRKKENKAKDKSLTFRFPLYLYTNYSDDEINNEFTNDEKILYQSELLFFNGEYKKCYNLLNSLLKTTKDTYVRFGALYHYCLTCVYLHKFGSAFFSYNEIQSLYLCEKDHKLEMELIVRNLNSYFVGNKNYIDNFHIDLNYDFPKNTKEVLILECAYSDMLKSYYHHTSVNPLVYEMILQNNNEITTPLSKLSLHLYLAGLCKSFGQNEKSVNHIRKACQIAKDDNLEYSAVAFMSNYLINPYNEALKKDNPSQLKRI